MILLLQNCSIITDCIVLIRVLQLEYYPCNIVTQNLAVIYIEHAFIVIIQVWWMYQHLPNMMQIDKLSIGCTNCHIQSLSHYEFSFCIILFKLSNALALHSSFSHTSIWRYYNYQALSDCVVFCYKLLISILPNP